jgi:hypothetical protein
LCLILKILNSKSACGELHRQIAPANFNGELHWQIAPLCPSLLAPLDGFLLRAVVCVALNLFSFEKYLEFLGELSHCSVRAVVGLEVLFNDRRG